MMAHIISTHKWLQACQQHDNLRSQMKSLKILKKMMNLKHQ